MNNILYLIPQRPPIVMVDEFIGMENDISTTRFDIVEDNIFVNDGIFSECGLIEHIAQSAGARVGYMYKNKKQPIPLGYIASVNDFVLIENPKVGETIYTTIEVVQEVFNITLIRAVCKIGGQEIASCKMKIYLDTANYA